MSEALALLKLLDAIDGFNRFARTRGEREPYPEGTAPITADATACAHVARQIGYPPEYVFDRCAGMPVKRLKAWRDARRDQRSYAQERRTA